MMTSSNGNIFHVIGHLCGVFTGHRWSPAQRPVTQSFGVFFDMCLNKRLSKQSWCWWFETPSPPWWRHNNEWWRYNMEKLFILLFICSNFLHKGQVTRYFDVWFVVSLYKLFNIQWSGQLFETPWRSCDVHVIKCQQCIMSSHYSDVIMSAVASQITSLTIVYSGTDQRKHQSSASLTFARGITGDRWICRTNGQLCQMFPFDDVIMYRKATWAKISYHIIPYHIYQILSTYCSIHIIAP